MVDIDIVREFDDPDGDLYRLHQDFKRLDDLFRPYGLHLLIMDSTTRYPLELMHHITLTDGTDGGGQRPDRGTDGSC